MLEGVVAVDVGGDLVRVRARARVRVRVRVRARVRVRVRARARVRVRVRDVGGDNRLLVSLGHDLEPG